MKAAPLLLAAALLAGCSTTLVRENPAPVRVADGKTLETAPLVEALLGFKGTRVQAANGAWKDQVFSAQCVLKADCERGETVAMRERDGHHAADVGGRDACECTTRRGEGEIEHALSLGDHAARGETRCLHDALGLRASDELGEDGEVVGRARGHAAED